MEYPCCGLLSTTQADSPNQVFDTTFCGDWAGSVWSQSNTCSALAPTCEDYVQNNPGAFAEAFWTVNSLRVYQGDGMSAVDSSEVAASSADTAGSVSSSQALARRSSHGSGIREWGV